MSKEQTIIDAIDAKKMLKFDYHDHQRIVEPHVYGIKDSKKSLQAYQTGGTSSSGGIPEWRRMFLDEISDLEILKESFPGKRPTPSGKHSSFDRIIQMVD